MYPAQLRNERFARPEYLTDEGCQRWFAEVVQYRLDRFRASRQQVRANGFGQRFFAGSADVVRNLFFYPLFHTAFTFARFQIAEVVRTTLAEFTNHTVVSFHKLKTVDARVRGLAVMFGYAAATVLAASFELGYALRCTIL